MTSPHPQVRVLEPLGLFGVVFLLVLGLALLGPQVSWIGANLYAFVAMVFIGVPQVWINRKDLSLEALGLGTSGLWRGVRWGVGASLLTLAPFALGQHLWATQVHQRTFDWDPGHWWQWSADLEGEPPDWGRTPGVWTWSKDRTLYVGLHARETDTFRVTLNADVPFAPSLLGTKDVLVRPSHGASAPSPTWEVIPKAFRTPVVARITPHGRELSTLKVQVDRRGGPPVPLHTGPSQGPEEEGHVTLQRGLGWLLLWGMTQLFFIALPEEYFYRGYLQTRLRQAFSAAEADALQQGPSRKSRWSAILLTSVCFGLGHLLVPVGGVLLATRFSVFFPSLLFGWLRERTGSIVAPTIYHACCNMMVIVLSVHYH